MTTGKLGYLLILVNIPISLTVFYHGEYFPCHCLNGICKNFTSAYYIEEDVCPNGCTSGWEGPGCQIGNVVEGKEATQTRDWSDASFGGTNLPANCNDGSRIVDESQNTCCAILASHRWTVDLGGGYAIGNVTVYGSNAEPLSIRGLDILLHNVYSYVNTSMVEASDELLVNRSVTYGQPLIVTQVSVKKHNREWYFRMCEVEAVGYQYRECMQYNNQYYYGPGCLLNCCCMSQCNYISGVCANCRAGYRSNSAGQCDVCPQGSWGRNCQQKCACNYHGHHVCDHVTGECVCVSGCFSIIAVVIAVCLVIVLLLIVVLVVFFLKRYRKKCLMQRKRKEITSNASSHPTQSDSICYANIPSLCDDRPEERKSVAYDDLILDENDEKNISYENLTNALVEESHRKDAVHIIKNAELGKCLANLEQDNGFTKEYSELPTYNLTTNAGNKSVNELKHRFKNIKAYDHSRIQLGGFSNMEGSDYINASYIRDYRGEQSFIASQAPRACTIDDMWRMIWQKNINVIVMLTNLKEGERIKCQQYWPESGHKDYLDISVEPLSTNVYSFYIERHWNVTRDGATRPITHIQYTNWPDHGVPESACEILHLYYKVKTLERSGPLLVHCSAGVGRTGTFIALDNLLSQNDEEQQVNVFKCVSDMRKDRCQMVQTDKQYRFLYQLLYEAIMIGNTSQQIAFIDPKNYSAIKQRFAALNTIYSNSDSHDGLTDQDKKLMSANSNEQYLYFRTRIHGLENCVNAFRCNSFKKMDAFILTPQPLFHSVVDIWRLVADHSIESIILLDDIKSEDIYWPINIGEQQSFGPLKIELLKESCDAYNGIVIRDVRLVDEARPSSNRVIRQWQVTNWKKNQEMFNCVDTVNQLIDCVSRFDGHFESDGAKLVQCLDGVQRSGLFVAYFNLIEMLRNTKEVDIEFVLKQLRCLSSRICMNLDDVYDLYHSLVAYADNTDVAYYNVL